MLMIKRWQKKTFANVHPSRWQPQLTVARCDYVEGAVTRLYGGTALGQEEILIVGCDQGQLCEELARRGAIILGLDDSPLVLEQAQRHARERALGHVIAYLSGRAEALPFASGSFSMVVCLQALAQVRDLRAAIAEMARVLAPGGLLVFEALNGNWPSRLLLNWLGERLPLVLGLEGAGRPRSLIRPRELAFLLTAYGLQPGEISSFLSRGLANSGLLWSLFRFTRLHYLGYAVRLPAPQQGSLLRSEPRWQASQGSKRTG
ncbi:MAG: methyltransferase domain-containing protein [Thermogemmatispora sp.]|uniref:class I SAM-dependent methyltransferase n=1 Tax=Thermogemmatispora sp. TaxID=1968838 RepID=UPI00261125A2|nr:class I SAM-dependent methyltransferase [Thermogemmatispora sp.]MBX5458440.1 methyltransferase domain-containing protein [Thermogemmatispora sp.]